MSGIMSLAREAIAKLNGVPTEAEVTSLDNLRNYLEKKERYREAQHTYLPKELSQFDPYTLPENFRVDPDVGPLAPSVYNNLRDKMYRHANNPKYAASNGLETLPAKDYNAWINAKGPQAAHYIEHPPLMSLSGAYAYPRAMAAAKSFGVPQLTPETLAGMYLQEGRTDFGANTADRNNAQTQKLIATLEDKYGMDRHTASFLALLKEKQKVADKLGVSLAEAWNGLGTAPGTSRTGKTYAKEFDKQVEAAQMPQNKNLLDMIRLGIEHGNQYPLTNPKAVEAYDHAASSGFNAGGIASLYSVSK